jgi:hypothetical protein
MLSALEEPGGTCPITRAVSMGRRNTELEVYLLNLRV